MRICYLTQTAHDVSDYYKEFFRGQDLFFITFKAPNPNALAFVPKSTWSDGRNKLWDLVKGKYDYYVFIDDDLLFYSFSPRLAKSPLLAYYYYKYYRKNDLNACFQQAKPDYFLPRLKDYINKYKPEVLSISQVDCDFHYNLETLTMSKNSFVRRMAHFDAQFTVLSNYAASKILPYDTGISGWWSSQIPVYLYSYHVFASKAISVVDLGVANNYHVGAYVENYNGILDCKKMIAEISEATGKDYSKVGSADEKEAIDLHYAEDEMCKHLIPKPSVTENYKANFDSKLRGLETLLHDNIVV